MMMNDVNGNDVIDDFAAFEDKNDDNDEDDDDDEPVTCVYTGTLESVELEIKVNNAACDRSYNFSHFIQFIYLFTFVCL